jgi:hypothetical protein
VTGACTEAARAALRVQDPTTAASFLQRACFVSNATRDAAGCHILAGLLEDGRGLPKDPPAAQQIWESLCASGWAESCFTLARRHERSTDAGGSSKSLALFERACDLGLFDGCYRAGMKYDEGQSVTPNEAKARDYFTKACDAVTARSPDMEGLEKAKAIVAGESCERLKDMGARVRPFERAVTRSFAIGHRDAPNNKVERSVAEAKQLSAKAVALLAKGSSFDEVADTFRERDAVGHPERLERVAFRMRNEKEEASVFSIKPGHALVHETRAGFLVVYRVR